jgi:hypothetical protein
MFSKARESAPEITAPQKPSAPLASDRLSFVRGTLFDDHDSSRLSQRVANAWRGAPAHWRTQSIFWRIDGAKCLVQ